jgi:predicted kinase
MESPVVIILCGIAGSGKTTWAEDLMDKYGYETASYISSDAIREELKCIEDMSKNNQVFEIFEQRYIDSLKRGKDVILDATLLKKSYRAKYIQIAKEYNAYTMCIFMDIDTQTAIERNAKRGRKVPEDVIIKMANSVEVPAKDEGFNRILFVNKNGYVSILVIDKQTAEQIGKFFD